MIPYSLRPHETKFWEGGTIASLPLSPQYLAQCLATGAQ